MDPRPGAYGGAIAPRRRRGGPENRANRPIASATAWRWSRMRGSGSRFEFSQRTVTRRLRYRVILPECGDCVRSAATAGSRLLRQLDRSVFPDRPARVVRHLPGVAVRVGEGGRVAAPEGLGGLAHDVRTGRAGLLGHGIHLG